MEEVIKLLPAFVRKRLEGRQDLQKIIGNTGWLFGDKILRMGVGLVVGAWVARYLGPAQYGLISYAGAFLALFAAIATMGLDGIVVRNLVNEPESRGEILGTSFVLKLVGGIITIVLCTGTSFALRPQDTLTHLLIFITAAVTIFQALDVIDFWFQSQVQAKFAVNAKIGAFFVVTVVRVIMVLQKASLVAFAVVNTAEIVLASFGLIVFYKKSGMSFSGWKFTVDCARKLLKDSWPLIFSGVVIMIYMRIDQVMIGQMVGDHEVGIYSSAVRLAEAWYFVPMAVASSTLPSVVEAKALGEERFYKRLQKLYNLMAFMAYAVAIPATFLSGWIVKILFGAAYSKAGPMLALLIWAGMFTNLGVARSSFLTAMNWTKIHFVTVSAGCVINIALNYVLIPKYGGMGAVVASFVAYWFAAHGSCFFLKPLHKTGAMLTRAMLYPRFW